MSMPMPTSVDHELPWNTQRATQNTPRPDLPKQVKTPQDPLAEIKPKLYRVGGNITPYYGIDGLAHVLRRKQDTLRKWEDKGWLPKPTIPFNGNNPDDEKSARYGQRRLYTRAQLLGLLQIAREEGILQSHSKPIKETSFPARAHKLFADLKARDKAERQRRKAEREASGRV